MKRVPITDDDLGDEINLKEDTHLDEMPVSTVPVHQGNCCQRKCKGCRAPSCSGRCCASGSCAAETMDTIGDIHDFCSSICCCLLRKRAQPVALCLFYLLVLCSVLVYLIAESTFDNAFNYYVEITSQLYAGPDVDVYQKYRLALAGGDVPDVCDLPIQPLVTPLKTATLLVAPSGGGVVRSYIQQASRVSTSSVFCQHEFEYSGGFPGECLPEWWFQHVSVVYTPYPWILPQMYPMFAPGRMVYVNRNPLDSAIENFSMRKARDHELLYFRAAGKIGQATDFETEEWKIYFLNFVRDWVQTRRFYDSSLLDKRMLLFERIHEAPGNYTTQILSFLSPDELLNHPECIENGGPLDFSTRRMPADRSAISPDMLAEACGLTRDYWETEAWGPCGA